MFLILWLNGPFGVGKTETADNLRRLLPDSFVYDPEDAGAFLVRHIPPAMQALSGGDYQNHPPWRAVNYEMLAYIAGHYRGTLIVPMTITRRDYWEETAGRLAKQHPLRQVLLTAPREVILRRLALRGDGADSWPAKQLDRCLAAFRDWPADEILDTGGRDAGEAARRIAQPGGLFPACTNTLKRGGA